MLKQQQAQISSLMDGELTADIESLSFSENEDIQKCIHRYHVVRDVMRGTLHPCSLNLDIVNQVAKAIDNEQPFTNVHSLPKHNLITKASFWFKAKEVISKVGQVGLAACVTLVIIAGVQYHNEDAKDSGTFPVLNTMPIGVNVTPVGGINRASTPIVTQENLDEAQYEKIRQLIQNYELQKRFNAAH